MDNPFLAARYHSLVIDRDSCPSELEITAWTADGTIMGVRHKQFPHVQVGSGASHRVQLRWSCSWWACVQCVACMPMLHCNLGMLPLLLVEFVLM